MERVGIFMKKKILIVEDDLTILRLVKTYFEKNNYEVYTSNDGMSAIETFNNLKLDLIIMDVMMPKLDGFETTKIIRSSSNIPIIMMTALDQETDMLKGYGLKIDDYIVKPFSPKVLVAKVNNLLARISEPENLKTEFIIGELKIDFSSYKAYINLKELFLSKTEFNLLTFLIKNKDKTCSRELLLDEIWGLDVFVDDRIIDTYIKTLRKQLKPYNYIKTVFGVGYRFDIEE